MGIASTGRKTPQRNIIGNRKKFERVWASKTSATDTATKAPSADNVSSVRIRQMIKSNGLTISIPKRIMATITITPDIIPPKTAPPKIFPTSRDPIEIGASRSRSRAP